MSDDPELQAAKAALHINEALEAVRRIGDVTEAATGYRVISPRRPSIADARRSDLERLRAQARAGERALDMALGWIVPGQALGAVLKVMPPSAAAELTKLLTEAGLLPDG